MMGDVKYNEKGLAFNPLIALQWWDGKRMPLYPPKPDVWTIKMPLGDNAFIKTS
jgi:hypothetical protein